LPRRVWGANSYPKKKKRYNWEVSSQFPRGGLERRLLPTTPEPKGELLANFQESFSNPLYILAIFYTVYYWWKDYSMVVIWLLTVQNI
jgi:hypothetical protein